LNAWAAKADVQPLLAALVRWYAVKAVLPETERKRLAELTAKAPGLADAVEGIRKAFDSRELRTTLGRSEVPAQFAVWARQKWQSEPFALLLKNVGDRYAQDQDLDMALARYATAYSLDPRNTDAALALATLLLNHPGRFGRDVEGLWRPLIRSLFVDGSPQYRLTFSALEDWKNLLRLHFVLGKICLRQRKEWGSAKDLYGPIGQWTRAEAAEARIRQLDPGFPPSPGLHSELAKAYRMTKSPDQAWVQYAGAAEAYLETAKLDQARQALNDARGLGLTLDQAQSDHLLRIEQGIKLGQNYQDLQNDFQGFLNRQGSLSPDERTAGVQKLRGTFDHLERQAQQYQPSQPGITGQVNVALGSLRAPLYDLARSADLTGPPVSGRPPVVQGANAPIRRPTALVDLSAGQRAQLQEIDNLFNARTADLTKQLQADDKNYRVALENVLTPQQRDRLHRSQGSHDPHKVSDLSPPQRKKMSDLDSVHRKRVSDLQQQLKRVQEDHDHALERTLTPEQMERRRRQSR
jgi:tetratricopeptide (TPR) repeat protein